MRIFDCFPVYDELEMVRARVYELRDIPHAYHLAVEMSRTHRGEDKPFYLDESYLPFEPGMDHLSDVRIVAPPADDPWVLERRQREAILSNLERFFRPAPDDLVLVSDADEIARGDSIWDIAHETLAGPVRLGMRMHYYSFEFYDPSGWAKAVAFRWADRPETLESLRMGDAPIVENAGWHLSYFMGAERIHRKLSSFAHSEFDTPEAHAAVGAMLASGVTINGSLLHRWHGFDLPAYFQDAQ